jgi:ABC-type sugar transport system ATPase subunit
VIVARIEITGLSRAYSAAPAALSALDLTVESGELLVVLGPSGSGKSTLLRLIAGLETPSAGNIQIDGKEITSLPPHERNVAMVFQHPALFPHLTVARNIAFGLAVRGVKRAERIRKVNDVAGILGLDQLLERKPDALSGGERQRVAVGRAIACEPKLLLLDEPFSSLDSPLRAVLREELSRIQRRTGITLIHVTHDQGEALQLGDRVAVLDKGRLLQAGPPRTVYNDPANRFVATFVGSPPMNVLPVTVERDDENELRVKPVGADVDSGWRSSPARVPPDWKLRDGRFDLGFRPEAIALGHTGAGESSGHALSFKAGICRLEFNGPELLVTMSLGPHQIIARMPAATALAEQDRVDVVIDLRHAIWFDRSTGAAVPTGVRQA